MTNDDFESLGAAPFFAARLKERNIRNATDIQKKVIPPLLAGQSVIFRSATGTGKTFAYLVPALQRLRAEIEGKGPENSGSLRYPGPAVLICAPTYELCSQIKAELDFLLAQGNAINTALLIGSGSLNRQIDGLKKSKPLVIVGNPGRLLVLAKMGKLKLDGLRFLALDEADRLCAEESLEETTELLRLIAHNGHRLEGASLGNITAAACSATVSAKTKESLSPLFADAPLLETDEQEILRERIEHWAIFSENRRRIITLRSLLAAVQTKKTRARILVFAGKNDEAGKVLSQLQHHHIGASALFGKMGKQERKAALDSFRAGKVSVLVSSDLAARGLDIPGITHVVALDVPDDKEAYIHRAGRTGRAGKRGIMVSIGDEQEMRRLAGLEKKLRLRIQPKELRNGTVCGPFENQEKN
jgi:superfamily II DNA/RNA helicase